MIEPSEAQRSRFSHDDFRRQKQRVHEFKDRQSTTPLEIGPPNAGGFGVLQNIRPEDRIPLNATIARLDQFEALRILPVVRQAVYSRCLNDVETKKPTPIQSLAIQKLMKLAPASIRIAQLGLLPNKESEDAESDEDYYKRKLMRKNLSKLKPDLQTYLIAAETGSGKTLSYLIPLMSMLKEEELNNAPAIWGLDAKPYIRSVILVPTAELVKQVLAVVKDLCHDVKLSSAGLSQESSREAANNIARKQIDILVSTPVPLLKLIDRGQNSGLLSDCRKIIVDEADSLMDRSFKEKTLKLLHTPSRLEIAIFCSATIPKSFDFVLRKEYPAMTRIVAPHLHQIPRKITFSTVDTSSEPFYNDKRKALVQTLYNLDKHSSEPGKMKRIVVFMNHRESVDELVSYLTRLRIPAVGLTRDNTLDERSRMMREFRASSPSIKHGGVDLVSGEIQGLRILVTTDIFSRGIDMNGVRTVILYDVPFSSIDLIHRAGRTGRMGAKGRVILLAAKDELKPWLRGLGTAINKGQALV